MTVLNSTVSSVALAIVGFLGFGCVSPLCGQGSAPLEQLLEQHRVHPSDWRVANQIAVSYTQEQQFDRAAEFYQKVITLNPAFLPARKNLGVVLWFLNRKKESESVFRSVLPQIPKDPVPHLYIALANYDRGQFAAAKEHFQQAGELATKNPEVLPTALDTYLATQDTSLIPAALQFVEQANVPELRNNVAIVFNRHGKYEATVGVLTANNSPDAESDALLAEAFDGIGQPQRAYATLANRIARNPADDRTYSALASFAAAHNNNQYALQVLDRGLQHNPNSPVLLVQRGLLTAISGDRDTALQSLEAAAQANPTWSLPLISRGVLELEAGSIAAAIETFRRAIAIAPQEHNGYYFCAMALNRRPEGGGLEAIALLQKALAISPDDAKCRVLLGQILLAQGRSKEGIAELERALRYQPDNVSALYQLALAYRRLGNTTLSEQRMGAFKRAKAKSREEQTALVEVLKVIK